MLAKIVNKETKQCDVFLGTDIEWAKAQGFRELEIEQAFNMQWYLKGYAPEKPAPTKEEQEQSRANAYASEIDPLHARKFRKTILGEWTEEDEAEYVEQVKELSAEIEERYPYPTDPVYEDAED